MDASIFVEDLYQNYEPRPRSINSAMYADMIRERAGPAAVSKIYPDGTTIFQDDGTSNHRGEIFLETASETFKTRVNLTIEAPRMADKWPIENVQWIIKEKVAKTSREKDLCRNLVASIPKRLCAVIDENGQQVCVIIHILII